MKHYLEPVFCAGCTLALLGSNFCYRPMAEEKMVIALKTDSFELAETDISTLAIGESQIIETDKRQSH